VERLRLVLPGRAVSRRGICREPVCEGHYILRAFKKQEP
jgi:hypothetical protein